jgi:hypothetical protein
MTDLGSIARSAVSGSTYNSNNADIAKIQAIKTTITSDFP